MATSGESTPLINRHFKSRTTYERLSLWMRRYRRSHKCVSSKVIILILCWSFSVSLINNYIIQGGGFIYASVDIPVKYFFLTYLSESLVMCFYPLAGFLADTKYGRFKMIIKSSQILLLSFFMGIILCGLILPGLFLSLNTDNYVLIIFLWCLLGITLCPLYIFIIASLVMFNANIIQFGVDQIQDSPADHQSLFIHWYVWSYYLGDFLTRIISSNTLITYSDKASFMYLIVLLLPVAVGFILIFILVMIVHYKKHWFIIDTARTNPYKLVYRVTKFACQHKVPICRSAFTYCEDDIPSGLDLGKSKYGGPFTTEEVENVKAFYGIINIIIALGIALFMNVASSSLLPRFFSHISPFYNYESYDDPINISNVLLTLLFRDDFLSSIVIVLFLPFYIVFVRPFLTSYKIRMFGLFGLGIILLLFSVTSTFITDTLAHTRNITNSCML